jgi:tRNA threonylcarbamoyladenosine biosynthesis protein TsaB
VRLILVDTAGPMVAVAAFQGGVCRLAREAEIVAGADGWLTPALADALQALGGVDAVGVVVGPGAFTGLRVGIAQALGLALARGVPVRAVPSLALRAASVGQGERVLAVLDARKERVYAQSFGVVDGVPAARGPAVDLPPEVVAREMAPGHRLVGEGATIVARVHGAVGEPTPEHGFVASGWPLCATLPDLDPAALAPAYLREPDAKPLG